MQQLCTVWSKTKTILSLRRHKSSKSHKIELKKADLKIHSLKIPELNSKVDFWLVELAKLPEGRTVFLCNKCAPFEAKPKQFRDLEAKRAQKVKKKPSWKKPTWRFTACKYPSWTKKWIFGFLSWTSCLRVAECFHATIVHRLKQNQNDSETNKPKEQKKSKKPSWKKPTWRFTACKYPSWTKKWIFGFLSWASCLRVAQCFQATIVHRLKLNQNNTEPQTPKQCSKSQKTELKKADLKIHSLQIPELN